MGRIHRRRTAQSAFTLIEVMVVVTILGLLATGIAVGVYMHFSRARVALARTQATTLRGQAQAWRATQSSEDCPTPRGLVAEGYLDESSKLTDPWDVPYEIRCEGTRTMVRSLGPDKQRETSDDIVVPDNTSVATL